MTQEQSILDYLKSGKSISPIEALEDFGCFRLASVVHSLKQKGHDIQTKIVGNGRKKWAQYYLGSQFHAPAHKPIYTHQQPGYGD